MSTPPGALDARSGTEGKGVIRARLVGQLGDALRSGSVLLVAGAGFGKTTLLEQAVIGKARVAWVSCTDAERAAGTLFTRIAEALARAAPGTTDALAERLSTGLE